MNQFKFTLQRFGTQGIKISYQHGIEIANDLINILRQDPAVIDVVIAGSLRRNKPTIGDVDLLIITATGRALKSVMTSIISSSDMTILSGGQRIVHALTEEGVQVDFYFCTEDEYVCMLNYLTGSQQHNIQMRSAAKQLGWKLNQYHLYDDQGNIISLNNEHDLYRVLNRPYKDPKDR